MTLQPCHECGKKISTEAAKCPHCGVQHPAVRKYARIFIGTWVAAWISFGLLVAFFGVVIFFSGPSSPPAGGEFNRFIGRLEDGADCPELFEIRNSVDPSSPLIEEMNSHLREIGCVSSWSVRER